MFDRIRLLCLMVLFHLSTPAIFTFPPEFYEIYDSSYVDVYKGSHVELLLVRAVLLCSARETDSI